MDWVHEIARAWEREYPELDSTTLPPLVRIARLGVLIDAFQREVLEPFGLSAADYGVLAMLRRGGAPYRLSPSLLYSRLQKSSGGMTKMLKRLEERGLVRRLPDPVDGRGLLVQLTRPGLRLQERVFNAYVTASNELFAGRSRRQKREADDMLRMLVDSFEHFLGGPDEAGEASGNGLADRTGEGARMSSAAGPP